MAVIQPHNPQPKTHITDAREVCYPWHPWYRQAVVVRETVIRAGQRVARCVRQSDDLERALEIPLWMLDPVTCCIRPLADQPYVDAPALLQLRELLCPSAGREAAVGQAVHRCPWARRDRCHAHAEFVPIVSCPYDSRSPASRPGGACRPRCASVPSPCWRTCLASIRPHTGQRRRLRRWTISEKSDPTIWPVRRCCTFVNPLPIRCSTIRKASASSTP